MCSDAFVTDVYQQKTVAFDGGIRNPDSQAWQTEPYQPYLRSSNCVSRARIRVVDASMTRLLAHMCIAIVINGQAKEQVSQADPARQDGVGLFQVNDLRKGLKTLLKPGCSMGFSNKTVYVLA